MSSEETRPLLGRENDRKKDGDGGATWAKIRALRSILQQSPVTVIIPVALASRLATQLPQTTTVYIVQQLVCRQWYEINDPQKLPEEGSMPDELCGVEGPKEWFNIILALIVTVGGIGTFVGYQIVNYIGSRYGRRPAMISVLSTALLANVFLITTPYMNSFFEVVWLIMWLLTDAVSNSFMMTFLVNLFIIDLVDAEGRSTMLSAMNGLATIGDTLSFTAGGNITTYTHEIFTVFYISVSLNSLALLYVLFILPESFTREQRDELQRERAEENSQHIAELSRLPWQRRLLKQLTFYLGPFKILKPTRNEHTGRRNWRLLICSTHVFIAWVGAGYGASAMVGFLTSKYYYKPADTGYVLGLYSLTGTMVLTFVIPFVFKVLRPFYRRSNRRGQSQSEENDADTASGASDRLDVHIAVVSWLLEATGFLLLSHATTRWGQYASVVVVGCSAARGPVFRSLVAASVEPLRQGEALAAVEMVASIALFISPLLMGSILASTISTTPALVFWVIAALIVVASAILLLVRDSDRYQKPHEE